MESLPECKGSPAPCSIPSPSVPHTWLRFPPGPPVSLIQTHMRHGPAMRTAQPSPTNRRPPSTPAAPRAPGHPPGHASLPL
uniref:Uncharacterized protein n=1 Tax=Arundo donax TaxID=35708 RepID=A0A0A9DHP5_ARUDO